MLGFFLLTITCLTAQNQEYVLKRKLDFGLLAGSSTLFLTTIHLQRQLNPLPDPSIRALKRSDVNAFDRIATYQYSGLANVSSDALLVGSILMKSYFYFNKKTRKNAFNIGLVSFQSLMLSQSISNTAKLSLRNRPLLYNENVPFEVKQHNYQRLSFFSAHTTVVSSACFSFAFAQQAYIPDGKYNKLIWASAFTIPAVEGFLRFKAGKHYPTDVIAAYLVGLGSSYLMHKLHQKKK